MKKFFCSVLLVAIVSLSFVSCILNLNGNEVSYRTVGGSYREGWAFDSLGDLEDSLLYLEELAGRREQVVSTSLSGYISDMDVTLGLLEKEDLSSVGFDFGDFPEVDLSGLENIGLSMPEWNLDEIKWDE